MIRPLATLAATAVLFAATGCAAVSLERHTLLQVESTANYRTDSALLCLAVVADNPAHLPPFSLLQDGTASVADSAALTATSTWTRGVSGAVQTLGPSASRSPQLKWSIDPVADHRQLEALRCACRWVVYGPDEACDACPDILEDAQRTPSPGPHFGVAGRLRRLRPGWLHHEQRLTPPVGALAAAHYGRTWVWVSPEDADCLDEFVLTLFDISTLSIGQNGAPDASSSPKVLVTLEKTTPTKFPKSGDANHVYFSPRFDYATDRVISPQCLDQVTASFNGNLTYKDEQGNSYTTSEICGKSWDWWMATTTPYHGARTSIKPDSTVKPPTAGSAMPTRSNRPLVDPQVRPLSAAPFGPDATTPPSK